MFKRPMSHLLCILLMLGAFPAVSHAEAPAPGQMSFSTLANITDGNYTAFNSGGGPGKIVVMGLAVDSQGNIFISSGGEPNSWEDIGSKRADNIIRKITPAGDVSRFTTGQEKYGYGGYVAPDGNNGNYYTTRTELSERLMHCPRGIAVDSFDNIYFADQGNGLLPAQSARVVKIDKNGTLQKVFMAEDTGGHNYSNFYDIQDLAVENGILYTLNMWTGKLVVTQFRSDDTSGNPVAGACVGGDFLLDGKGLLESKGICVKDNKLYIADTGNARIIRMDVSKRDGSGYAIPKNAVAFELEALGLGSVAPQDVAADSQGNMYLTDAYFSGATYNYRVIRLDSDGRLLAYGGTRGEGTAPNQFNTPQQIAVGNDGKVYVSDWLNYRVQVFSPGASAAPTLNASVSQGTASGSVKADIVGSATAKFIADITDSEAARPAVGDAAPSNGANLVDSYAAGTDITVGVAAGKWLQIYDVDNNGGVVRFYQKRLAAEDIKAPSAPSVTVQPSSRAITAGQTAVFTITAAGDEPLSYQWQKDGGSLTDGGNLSGANSNSLTIANARKADAGSYVCHVSNAAGNTVSVPAVLTVNAAPNRRPGVPAAAAASVNVNSAYALDLSTIFEDDGGSPLTYIVSINGAEAVAANKNYYYTPTVAGAVTLLFKACDGTAESGDAYTVTLTALSAGGIGGGTLNGNESGGGGAPAAPAYKAEVSGVLGAGSSPAVAVDTKAGGATVELEPAFTKEIFAAAGTTVLTMPSIPEVNSYTITMPAASLSSEKGEGALTFSTGTGSVTIPSGMLAGIPDLEDSSAGITVSQGDMSGLPDEVKAAVGGRPLIRLTLTIDGRQAEWNNPHSPVKVSIPYTPTAAELENPESIIVWYIDGEGRPVPIPDGRYDAATGTVTFNASHFSDYAVAYNRASFIDVASGAWYSRAVGFIAARGITEGTGGGNFSPEARLTRGQFVVMLMKACGLAPDANPEDNFADAGGAYYTGYLAAAKRLGIAAGVGGDLFAPEREISRQELFTLLYNALKANGRLPRGDSGKTLSDFADAGQIDSWAKEAMALLVKTGVACGDAGKLSPLGKTTRAEMAQTLYNLLSK